MKAFLAALLAAGCAELQEKSPDRPLEGLAAKCGSEIPWTTSLDDARKLSRESKKPIAWWVTTLAGSPMDRKLVVEKYMLAGPFMMPAVVELLSKEFVPLRLEGRMAHRKLGVEPMAFIEPGLVFLTPELEVLHRADRISTFSEEWFVRLLHGVLEKAGRKVERRAVPERKLDVASWETKEGAEARYWHGVALHLAGRDGEGRAEWRKATEGRWAWKAAAELARDGPFVRGFEIYEPPDALPALPQSTTSPARQASLDRPVRFLLRMQRSSGVWDDSNYNFGGDDSLPNVYMAITALAALALRESAEDGAIKSAVLRAEEYLRDEAKVATSDRDEIVWAHAYRLLYFARAGDKAMMARLVKKLADLQQPSGIWYHEYDNPFAAATALHALHEAKKAGADVPEAALKRGADALKACRDAQGFFSYGYPGRGDRAQGGAGRMPLCEFALSLAGESSAEKLRAAVQTSLKHHPLLEKVRKYDDHADAYRNGGFFFWYDQYGRALAAKAAGDDASLAEQKRIVLSIPEIDGCWVDSHELGRVYGTAMALLTLKLCN